MKHFIRRCAAVLAVTTTCWAVPAQAAYPDRLIRLIVPFETGGTVNLIGRILAQHLGEALGQSVIVENKPGAGGTLGADMVAKAPPDGYTLLLASSGHQSIHSLLYKKLPYDPQKAFTQVALFASVPNVLAVSSKLPVRNVKELIDYTRKHPQPLFMGSAGNGSVNHLIGELFQYRQGVKFEHVPYKGAGSATMDLMTGQIDLMFVNLPNVLSYLQGGKMRALAVTSDKRSGAQPQVPTMAEAGVADFVVDSWSGVLAPAGTPQAVIDKLSVAITKVAKDPATVQSLAQQGAVPMPGSSAEYAKLVQFETQRWGDLLKQVHVKLN